MTDEDDDPRQRAAATKRERSRSALTAAATTLFNEQGYEKTSMEDIAAQAGVSVATAYNYFSTKDQLPSMCLGPLLDDLGDSVRHDLNAGANLADAISRHLHGAARVLQRNRRLVIAFMSAYLAHKDTGTDGFNLANTADQAHDLDVWTKLARPLADLLDRLAHVNEFDVSESAITITGDNYGLSELYIKALVMRIIDYPDEPADRAAEFVLMQMPTA